MAELPHFSNPEDLRAEVWRLINLREGGKQPRPRDRPLSRDQRLIVHAKTDGRCHVCGEVVDPLKFEADHVKNHTSGGASTAENYLPACKTCNGYRWHYLPQELQWILKLGIWAKTQVAKGTPVGHEIAKGFVGHERRRENRRRNPRSEIGEPKSVEE
jgi:5-methylcytosine-specific restriction endonuclease McrA